ncbi:hypothetical protein L596_013562 [Steinernema carpocapsae]|uniref:Uncharacterized protein n=1 Tax=Steinernema carpocapsae TaxID=34508 RepID=A0A4U5P1E7_STECR|nr:hypothetical protein L596_013562 [Steinernema carpocapsae]
MRVQARCIFSPWNTQRDAFWYVVSIQFSPEESQCVLKKKFEAWDAPSKMPELGRPEGILGVAQRRDACHVVAGAAAPASSDGSWSLSGSAAHVKEVAKDCGMFSYKKLDSTQKPSKPNETASTRLKRRPASVNEPLVKAEVQASNQIACFPTNGKKRVILFREGCNVPDDKTFCDVDEDRNTEFTRHMGFEPPIVYSNLTAEELYAVCEQFADDLAFGFQNETRKERSALAFIFLFGHGAYGDQFICH